MRAVPGERPGRALTTLGLVWGRACYTAAERVGSVYIGTAERRARLIMHARRLSAPTRHAHALDYED